MSAFSRAWKFRCARARRHLKPKLKRITHKLDRRVAKAGLWGHRIAGHRPSERDVV